LIVELVTSMIAGGLFAATKFYDGSSSNDAEKISRIAANCGLTISEGKKIQTIHLLQKRKIRQDKKVIGTEYIYRLPYGLSIEGFRKNLKVFEDGLNTKAKILDVDLNDLRTLKLSRNIFKDLYVLLNKTKRFEKELEVYFDGALKIRVYDSPLTKEFTYTEDLFSKCKGWEVPIGVTRNGLIKHDFDEVYNMVIGGSPGYGKSVMLKNIITTLIARKTKEVTFDLVDLKGGLAFNRFRLLDQVKDVAKTPQEALETLQKAQERMSTVLDYLLKNGYEDVKEAGMKERHFIVIDEAADLSEQKEALEIVKDIARRGRGAGFRMVYATQYPTNETLPSQVRQNSDSRLCFKLQTGIASRAVLDQEGAESLPFIRGRAIYQTDRNHIVQTPYITNDFINETIKPNITFKARKERKEVNEHPEKTAPRTHSLVIEETRLS
jgi:DNA segregation ATPase FtsK/SpoIIIE, S-DNA-T family